MNRESVQAKFTSAKVAEADVPAAVPYPSAAPALLKRGSFLEQWLNDHLTAVAAVLVAAGFAIRVWVATQGYLNPDEAVHYMVINQPSSLQAYKVALTQSHPPLLYLLLYFWHLVGRSEVMLRLPSVLAGAAFCWFSFKWMQIFFGRVAGLIGLITVTFNPALISLSCEVREYALLVFCMAAALYFLGRALEEQNERHLWLFFVFLYLAILSHYSAAFFALALGIYSIVRIADRTFPRRFVAYWVFGEIGVALLYGFLYAVQLSKFKQSIAYWSIPFEEFYFHWQDGDLFFFLRHNTSNIFLYLFKQKYLSEALFLAFAIAVVLLFVRGMFPLPKQRRSFHLGILVVLPFLAIWGAAVARQYPYLGSRHTIFLAPFMIAGVSFLLAIVVREKLWAGLLVAGTVMAVANASEDPSAARITAANQRRELMAGAIESIHRAIPKTEPILVDYQSSVETSYYLCGSENIAHYDPLDSESDKLRCGGYTIASLKSAFWKLKPDNLGSAFRGVAAGYHLKPGDRIWVFQVGWGANLDVALPAQLSEFRCLTSQKFGKNISIIPFLVGPDLSPAAPVNSCVQTTKPEPPNLPAIDN